MCFAWVDAILGSASAQYFAPKASAKVRRDSLEKDRKQVEDAAFSLVRKARNSSKPCY